MGARQPRRPARAARPEPDPEDEEREATDQIAERRAPVGRLDADVVRLAALSGGGHPNLDSTGLELLRQARDHRALLAREHLHFVAPDVGTHARGIERSDVGDGDRRAGDGVGR